MTHDGAYQANSEGVAADELKSFVDRIESLDEQAKVLNEDRKEIYLEVKDRGFNVKALKKLIAMRRLDEDERRELETILDLYKTALRMA